MTTAHPHEPDYESLVRHAPVAIFTTTGPDVIAECNDACASLLGFESAAQAAGIAVRQLYVRPSAHEWLLSDLRADRRVDLRRVQMRRRDGAILEVLESASGAFDESGRLVRVHDYLVDVTALAAREAALRGREHQYHSVFSSAADGMLILDDGRAILEANPAAEALFQAPASVLTTRRLDDLVVGGAIALSTAWDELIALGESRREHQIAAADGGLRVVECSYRARLRVGCHLCVARDITERRMLEQELAESQRIESVGRLAGGIAHDFNNLLTAILGYTELMLVSRKPDDPDRSDLEEIQNAGRRAATLTHQLLAFSRKQMLLPREIDLNQAVADVRAMLRRLIREDIAIVCEAASRPALVRIDPHQLEQAIVNLVLNARDALPSGGRIDLSVSHARLSAADLPAGAPSGPGEYVRLVVHDNGVGIPAEVREHLFEPFFTTKGVGEGSGLGLASVHGTVRQSNGFITVESRLGEGTTFTMHFPAVGAARPNATAAPALVHEAEGGSGHGVLLVDDEESVRVIVGTMLRRHGYQVIEAATPTAALEAFDRHRGAIDLLVSDVVMPEMNGQALAERLVAVQPDLRVVFISGYTDVRPTAGIDSPRVGFLRKPFQSSALAAKVREVLSAPSAAAAARGAA